VSHQYCYEPVVIQVTETTCTVLKNKNKVNTHFTQYYE